MQFFRKHLVLIGLVILSLLAFTWDAKSTPSDTKSPIQSYLDSLRESREKQQKLENEISRGVWEKCYSEALTLSGKVFDEQQGIAYKCWTSEKQKLIYGTGNLTPSSEVPPKGIIQKVSASELTIVPRAAASELRQVKSEKQSPSISAKNMPAQIVEPISHIESLKKNTNVSSATPKSEKKKSSAQSVKKNEQIQSSEKSKHWKAYDTAITQIHKWEWLRLTAYWDHGGYSIGYGSRAKSSTEKITKAEADRRLVSIVTPLLTQVQKDFPTLRAEAQGALVSFAYNCHRGYQSVRHNGLQYHSQWCKTASGERLQGLVERRAEESRLIFSK